MKAQAIILSIFVSAVSVSLAHAGEAKECFFRESGKDGLTCKVRVERGESGAASTSGQTPAAPVAGDSDRCEKVKLKVDCDCDFKLEDEYAREFEKKDQKVVVGTEREKLAALVIKDEDRNDRNEAILTISGERDEHSFARRLEGECRGDN